MKTRAVPGEPVKILLVDDDPKGLIAIEALLDGEGYDLVKAQSGREALARLLRDDFALIIMDVAMPEMDGFETAEQFRMRPRSRLTPIIFLSGSDPERVRARLGYTAGAVDYLTKPILPDILRSKVAVFADLARAKAEITRLAQAAEAQVALLLRAAGEGIFGTDRGGRVTFTNQAAERMLGYASDELRGTVMHLLVHHSRPDGTPYPEDECPIQSVLRDAEERRGGGEVFWRKDGSSLPIEYVSTPLMEDGSVVGAVVVFRDVTERLRAEEALRRSENRYRLAATATNDAVWEWDFTTNATEWSAGAQRLFGFTPEELAVGEFGKHIHPEDVERVLSGMSAVLSGGGASWSAEYRFLRRDGSYAEVVDRAFVERGPDGLPVRMIGAMADVTERKRAEREIRQLNAELEERVRERTAQIEAAMKELESFSYSVSHDLRAPLRSIDGFSQALAEECADQLDEQGRHYVGRILAATKRMGELIEDMLQLSRVTRAELNRKRVDLSAVARDVAADMRLRDPGRNVSVEIQENVTAAADPRLARIVLDNLIGNAWKYTNKHPEARIEFGVTEHKGERAYFVRDDGAGFDIAYAAKLFGAFQRLHTPEEFEGSGIGLAIVQRIIMRHGGRVWAEGAVEQGATFYFTFGPA